jgi:hypothetical protein
MLDIPAQVKVRNFVFHTNKSYIKFGVELSQVLDVRLVEDPDSEAPFQEDRETTIITCPVKGLHRRSITVHRSRRGQIEYRISKIRAIFFPM